jgi:acetyl-CoA/propionyl-CoA carboxylase biotin carboxyl carrier protein
VPSPWDALEGFRVNEGRSELFRLRSEVGHTDVLVRHVTGGLALQVASTEYTLANVVLAGTKLSLMCNGERLSGRYAERDGKVYVSHSGSSDVFEHPWTLRSNERAAELGETVIKAPMPGKIIGVLVSARDRVQVGTPLLRLEAMKMEHTLKASLDGVVSELSVQLGQQVEAGSTLLVLKAGDEPNQEGRT